MVRTVVLLCWQGSEAVIELESRAAAAAGLLYLAQMAGQLELVPPTQITSRYPSQSEEVEIS